MDAIGPLKIDIQGAAIIKRTTLACLDEGNPGLNHFFSVQPRAITKNPTYVPKEKHLFDEMATADADLLATPDNHVQVLVLNLKIVS